MRVCMLAILLALTSACAPKAPRIWSMTESWGIAYWDCRDERPSAWVNARVVLDDPALAVEIAAHEKDHVEYMESYGGCEAWNAAVQAGGSTTVLDMEVRAYCRSSEVAVSTGRHADKDSAIKEYARKLSHTFGFSQREAESILRSYCTRPHANEHRPNDGAPGGQRHAVVHRRSPHP